MHTTTKPEKKKRPKVVLGTRVDPGLVELLEQEADRTDRSKGYVLDKILKEYFQAKELLTVD